MHVHTPSLSKRGLGEKKIDIGLQKKKEKEKKRRERERERMSQWYQTQEKNE
jgi:hypothetical protein